MTDTNVSQLPAKGADPLQAAKNVDAAEAKEAEADRIAGVNTMAATRESMKDQLDKLRSDRNYIETRMDVLRISFNQRIAALDQAIRALETAINELPRRTSPVAVDPLAQAAADYLDR